MESLIKQRGYIRARVTKLSSKIEENFSDLSSTGVEVYVRKLNELKCELGTVNNSIHMHESFDASKIDEFLDEEEAYDDSLGSLLVRLERFSVSQNSLGNQRSVSNTVGSSQKIPLPQLNLPNFSNKKDENLRTFLIAFESIIDKYTLTDFEKFTYLKGQLKGGPLALINSLDVNKQQYANGKKLLEEAFECTLNAKKDSIKRLLELKLYDGKDPYVYIGEMKAIISNFDTLDVKVTDILQYFVWQSFTDRFRAHLVAITNKSYPSMDEINDNLFEACNRYLKDSKKVESTIFSDDSFSSTSMAVNIEQKKGKFNKCSLCMTDRKPYDHLMKYCPIYETPAAKINKLRKMNACIYCSFLNHTSENCRFKFSSPCKHCKKNHMNYLCLKYGKNLHNSYDQLNDNKPKKISAVSSVASVSEPDAFVVEVAFSSGNGSIALPTFTADICGKNGKTECRVFKDGGCQRTFISSTLVSKLQ